MRSLLLFLLLLCVVYFLRRKFSAGPARSAPPESVAPPAVREAEQVLPCAHCGVLVPHSEGVESHGRFYCSAEHAQQGPAAG
jgi:uncharacterized protein